MEEERLTKRERKALAKEEKRKEREKKERFTKIRNWIIGILVLASLMFVGYKVINWVGTPVEEVDFQEILEVSSDDWIKGDSQVALTLVEYSDFQCLACKNYSSLIKQLYDEYSENLRVVYRHFPLVSIHKNAQYAALAAEAAGKQNKFWEMHDKLFEKQDEWAEKGNAKGEFIDYAKELELDEELFKSDFESKELEEKVKNSIYNANRLKVNSTPTFFLNGEKIQPGNYDELKSIVESKMSSE